MHQYKLLKEIRSKAFKNYVSNPFDDEVRSLFLETNQLFLTTEADVADDDDEDNSEEEGENWDYSGDGGDGGFNIFGDDEDEDSTRQSSFRKVRLIHRNPVDPPFGLKAALCFDTVNEYELSVIKTLQKLQAGEVENMPVAAGIYEPFVHDKLKTAKKKYDDALKNLDTARMSGTSLNPRKELTFQSFVADEFGNIVQSDLPKNLRAKFLSKSNGDLGKYISRDQVGATVTGVGAGELEFLARMFFLSVGGSYPGISGKIKIGESVSKDKIEEQEQELYKLAPSTVGYNSMRTLRDYLSHAVREALQPIVREIRLDDFIDIGIDHVIDGISQGKYRFENANLAAWAFQVMKNKAKDLLKKVVDYNYDDSRAADWTSTLSFPLVVYSKANPQAAISLKTDKLLNFSNVDTEKKYSIKGENDKFYKYFYDNEYDFLEDLRTSNGFYKDAEMGQKETAGRKKQYLKDSPLYYQNLSLMQRKKFMTSLPKERFATAEDFPELSTSQVPVLDEKGREAKALETTKNMQGYLDNVVSDIYNKIISDTSNKYSQKGIMSYLKYNPELTKKLIKGLLNFGVYKFQRDHYDFVTSPETYLQEFFNDVFQSEYPGRELPNTISNGKSEIPVFEKNARSGESFMQDMRRIVLGGGTEGREALPLAMKGDKESAEEFRKRMLTKSSGEMKKAGGFLIQNPNYLRGIYKMLANMSVKALVGREGSKGVDESTKNVKSLINEIRKDFTSYKNQITKNFVQTWN